VLYSRLVAKIDIFTLYSSIIQNVLTVLSAHWIVVFGLIVF